MFSLINPILGLSLIMVKYVVIECKEGELPFLFPSLFLIFSFYQDIFSSCSKFGISTEEKKVNLKIFGCAQENNLNRNQNGNITSSSFLYLKVNTNQSNTVIMNSVHR